MSPNDAAWQAAYRCLESPLFNVLLRMLWDASEAEDVLHDAFLRLWDQRERVRLDGIDALVYHTALNLARNRLRWRTLRQWVGLDDAPELTSVADPEQAQRLHELQRVLASMPKRLRETLLLSEFGGLSTREIAAVLGIAEGTVGSRKHAALNFLRQHWNSANESV